MTEEKIRLEVKLSTEASQSQNNFLYVQKETYRSEQANQCSRSENQVLKQKKKTGVCLLLLAHRTDWKQTDKKPGFCTELCC